MVYTAAIVSGLGLLQYFGINLVPHGQYTASGMIAYGTMPHPDFFGTYTAFILPAAIFLFLRSKKLYDLLFPALISAGQIVSLCRGTWIASLIGLLIVIWYAWNKPELRKNLFVLLGSLGCCIGINGRQPRTVAVTYLFTEGQFRNQLE